jgi:zinc D-Ala-D-Ala carboxypeptidase
MAIVTDWSKYAPYFTRAEFACKHTGRCDMDEEFMNWLLQLRLYYGRPIKVRSGFRDPSHPVEAKKGHGNGEHTKGRCLDVLVEGEEAFLLVSAALSRGARRIGVSQKPGLGRFIHIGLGAPGLPEPRIWSY